MDIIGEWIKNPDVVRQLMKEFNSAQPFQYVVINDFFSTQFAEKLYATFPEPCDGGGWHLYKNPIEYKYALNDFTELPDIQGVFETLNEDRFIQTLRTITDIPDLVADPHLHGAGLHAYPRGGKLDMHLDYCIHPVTGMERRLNLIVYMSKGWRPEFGGELQFGIGESSKTIAPGWNTAILFYTGNESFHGVPTPITCPDGEYRKSIAVYYVTPPQPDADFARRKAQYFPLPGQPVCAELRRLYDIRKTRLISDDDLAEWPNWEKEGNGYWCLDDDKT